MHSKKIIAMSVILTIVFSAGLLACQQQGGGTSAEPSKSPGDQKIMYQCPMHPSYVSDRPGECPICGMTLVPVKKESGEAARQMPGEEQASQPDKEARTAITIDPERQQRIAVTTAEVARGPAAIAIRAAGRVAFDPDLAIAQREFLEARHNGDRSLAEAARRRLTIMGMGKEQLGELARRGRPDESLVLADKGAWIYAAIYERELPSVHEGQSASIELPDGTALGSGMIRAIDAVLDPVTRTARARIAFANPEQKLRPNMFVTAVLHDDLGERLLVPKSAVIDSGKRKLVFVVHDGKHFMPREVVLGPELADHFVVASGLDAGDVVATSALFLIDSESQLKAAIGAAGGHKHD